MNSADPNQTVPKRSSLIWFSTVFSDSVPVHSVESCDILYRKNSKIWDTSNNCHNCPKNRKV